jgi:hypothetical protein
LIKVVGKRSHGVELVRFRDKRKHDRFHAPEQSFGVFDPGLLCR